MVSPEKEREAVKAAYKNKTWWAMVDQKSDAEVIAIYKRLKSQQKV